MSTAPVITRVRFIAHSKYLLFGCIALMMLYVLHHNERFLVDHSDPNWAHIQPFRWWLLPHGIAGACAVFLGPLQFSDRLRQRYLRLHRVLGRIYVVGALVAAPLGVYIQYFEEHMGSTRFFTLAAVADATLLMLTTGIAFLFILRGNVQQHRQWMTRSYAVALVFFEVRFIGGVTGWDLLGDRVVEVLVWWCLAFAILSADLVLQWQDSVRKHSVARGGMTAAQS